MIGIVDYGVGNLRSLSCSLSYLGLEHLVSGEREKLKECKRLILPGVGAFGDARAILRESGLDEFLIAEAQEGKPLLGICLGMQLLLQGSEEFGSREGLKLISGRACPLKEDVPAGFKVPHMGWNSLKFCKNSPLFKYSSEGEWVYFVHSFYGNGCGGDTLAVSDYGIPVTAAVGRKNVFGTQFHPEKSGSAGLKILRAFSEV